MKISDDHQWLEVGNQRWLVHLYRHEDVDLPDTSIEMMRTRQALIMLESGWYVSVIWGTATYSSNYGWFSHRHRNPTFTEEPAQVEVALRDDENETLISLGSDTVAGYVSADELNFMLDWLSRHGKAEFDDFLDQWLEMRGECRDEDVD